MAYDESLAKRIREVLAAREGTSEKKMFGGIAFMLNEHMACGIVGDKLMLRVGPERYDELLSMPHVEPMNFTGRPMRGMIYVSALGTRTQPALRKWIELALHVAETAPAKQPKKPKKSKSKATAASEKRLAKLREQQERARPKPFTGVPKETLAFLRGLQGHNPELTLGCGIHCFESEQLAGYRNAVVDTRTAFIDFCVAHYKRFVPMHQWLLSSLAPA